MSSPSYAAEQLLELLIQLKKTTPTAARSILNAQPQIAYALITLMVNMNAINVEVFQNVLAEYSNGSNNQGTPVVGASSNNDIGRGLYAAQAHAHSNARTTPVPSMITETQQPYAQYQQQHYQGPNGNGAWGQQASYSNMQFSTAGPSSYAQQGYEYAGTSYGGTQHEQQPNPESLAVAVAAMPDDQKALIMRVLTMTPDQINSLPQQERQAYVQLRATLGIPT